MSTITDSYGRTITISSAQGQDVYTLGGLLVSFPTGTLQSQALNAIEGMAPAGYSPPKVNYSFLEFMGLFTPAEQAAIVESADVQVKLFVMMATGAGQLQLGNPEVAQGVQYLVSLAILTADRAAAILAGQAPS